MYTASASQPGLFCPHKLWLPPWSKRPLPGEKRDQNTPTRDSDKASADKKADGTKSKPRERPKQCVPIGSRRGWGGVLISRILSS